jgi:5'(3')-deoxyribonucleotidase
MYGLDCYFNSIIFCEKNESKSHIAKAMDVDIMIDDKESVLENFDKSIKTILFKESEINSLLRKIIS